MSQAAFGLTNSTTSHYFYGMPHQVYLPIKQVRIDLYVIDGDKESKKSFANLQDFGDFLREHPEVTIALGHTPKAKK